MLDCIIFFHVRTERAENTNINYVQEIVEPMSHPDAGPKKEETSSPTEVHPYEFAANRTLGLFLRLAKRIIIFLITMSIIFVIILLWLTR